MSKQTVLICDCGCAQTATDIERRGWFYLDQKKYKKENDLPKLSRRLHFADLNCVNRWTVKAGVAVAEIQESIRGLSPRSDMGSNNVKGLYI